MDPAEGLLTPFRPLSTWLTEHPSATMFEQLQLFRRIAAEVQSLHCHGLIHGSVDLDHVRIGPNLEVSLAPASAPLQLGGQSPDPECCPPEFAGLAAVDLPPDVEAAQASLATHGVTCDGRRIDVYQLGVLLCHLVAGESVMAYLYDADVKRRIPAQLRPVLDRALGHEAATRLSDCEQMLRFIDDALARLPSSDAAARETPPAGSVVAPGNDTVSIRPESTPIGGLPDGKASPHDMLPSGRMGHFRLIERIGRGGMGDVYKAYDESLERLVAIKVLPPELARDEEFVLRFRAEAVAAAKIGHPNIVPVHFIGQEGGLHYFAMQYIEGESLDQRLRRLGRLSAAEVLNLTQQCLGALQAAHGHGLVHRDVKPGNILLEAATGRALLVDFGLVRAAGSAQLTVTGTVMGTVDYIAPEQARGQPVDNRADIYSLGVVLYQLLAGRLPFEADSAAVMIFRHAYEPPFPLDEAAPDAPAPLRTVVARMMAKNPAERYQSCQDVGDALRAVQEGRTVPAAHAAVPLSDAELEPPDTLADLTGPRRFGRMRDWAATIFRRHAPEFVKQLQTTSQWIDGAVAEYERRAHRLAQLAAEAQEITAALSTQLEVNRTAAEAAAQEAARATDDVQRRVAEVSRQHAEENTASLEAQLQQQQSGSEEIEVRLRKVKATLARLRGQRDLLLARFQMANLRRQLETPQGTAPAKGIPTSVILLIAVLFSLAIVIPLARYLVPVPGDHRAEADSMPAPIRPHGSAGRSVGGQATEPRPVTEQELAHQMIRNSIGMELVLIPAGQFMMGTDQRDVDLLMAQSQETGAVDQELGPNELPIHNVRISKPFYLGRLEVTQKQYETMMGNHASRWMAGAQPQSTSPSAPSSAAAGYGDYPVDSVDFTQAEEFCKKLSRVAAEKQAGRTYRLPTEAEWEYACRAGSDTAYCTGAFADASKFNYADRGWKGVFRSSRGGTVLGGSYSPNAFGLFDMHGNVAEWCADDYVADAYAHSAIVDPKVPATTVIQTGQVFVNAHRVLRGGSCVDRDVACRCAFRGHGTPPLASSYPTGFRVVCEVK